ncbi:hypothetical protein ACMZ6Y_00310 [Streptococcus pluranimalium]
MGLVKIGDVWVNPKYIIAVQGIERYTRQGLVPAVQITTTTYNEDDAVIVADDVTVDQVIEIIQRGEQDAILHRQ